MVRKYNEIVSDHGSWLEVDISTKKYPNTVMKIDKDDWYRLVEMNIYGVYPRETFSKDRPYAFTTIGGSKRKYRIHRLVLGCDGIVDHVNGDTLDNRMENIRECTFSQNLMNTKVRSDNTSGHKGVYLMAGNRTKKWCAFLNKSGNRVYTKCFEHLDDAIAARKEQEIIHFGEFTYNGD